MYFWIKHLKSPYILINLGFNANLTPITIVKKFVFIAVRRTINLFNDEFLTRQRVKNSL